MRREAVLLPLLAVLLTASTEPVGTTAAQCRSQDCLDAIAGVERTTWRTPSGMKRVKLSSKHSTTDLFYGFTGELTTLEVRNSDDESAQPVRREEYFRGKRVITQWVPAAGLRIERTFLAGRPRDRLETRIWRNGELVQSYSNRLAPQATQATLSSCVLDLDLPIDPVQSLPQILDGGEKPALIRVGATYTKQTALWAKTKDPLFEGLKKGIECMSTRLQWSASKRRGQLLTALLAGQAGQFTIDCKSDDSPPRSALTPDVDKNLGLTGGKVAWPGFEVDLQELQKRPKDIGGVAFHEALHSLGYLHGEFPDIASACEKCCIDDERLACEACSMEDHPTDVTPRKRATSYRLLAESGTDPATQTLALSQLVASIPYGEKPKATDLLEAAFAITNSCGMKENEKTCIARTRTGLAALQLAAQKLAQKGGDTGLAEKAEREYKATLKSIEGDELRNAQATSALLLAYLEVPKGHPTLITEADFVKHGGLLPEGQGAGYREFLARHVLVTDYVEIAPEGAPEDPYSELPTAD